MQSVAKIRLADALVKIMEKEGIKYIFGHPGEQILPVYQSLRKSSIKHVLMRHEHSTSRNILPGSAATTSPLPLN